MTLVNERWIEERTRLEKELRRARRLAAVSRLAAGVAHDCNNLLTAIQGYGELALSRLGPGDPMRADVDEIVRAATRASALTRQLLTFGSGLDRAAARLDLSDLVRGLETLLRRMLGPGLELRTALAGEPLAVDADASQLEQVVLNLVLNARDAMPSGGVVSIETDRSATAGDPAAAAELPPGPYARLVVHDTGVGMSEEVRLRAFEPFFSTKERDRGSGLGLATASAIVGQFAGAIALASQPGVGTTASVYLPLGDTLSRTRT